jgi:hypothetical protein
MRRAVMQLVHAPQHREPVLCAVEQVFEQIRHQQHGGKGFAPACRALAEGHPSAAECLRKRQGNTERERSQQGKRREHGDHVANVEPRMLGRGRLRMRNACLDRHCDTEHGACRRQRSEEICRQGCEPVCRVGGEAVAHCRFRPLAARTMQRVANASLSV